MTRNVLSHLTKTFTFHIISKRYFPTKCQYYKYLADAAYTLQSQSINRK